jgi:hypothetical protein
VPLSALQGNWRYARYDIHTLIVDGRADREVHAGSRVMENTLAPGVAPGGGVPVG